MLKKAKQQTAKKGLFSQLTFFALVHEFAIAGENFLERDVRGRILHQTQFSVLRLPCAGVAGVRR